MWDPKSLEERQVPPMSAEMFAALVTARVRPLEGIELKGGKGLQLKVRVQGQDKTAHLDRYYEQYRANPENLSPVIDEFIGNLMRGETEIRAGNLEFAGVSHLLMPRMITAQQWMTKRDEGFRLIVKSIAQDLGAALVLDQGDAVKYVELEAIPLWEIDSQIAYQVAVENLERASVGVETRVSGEGLETFLVDHSPNASARIMLESRLEDWQARISGELVVGMPTHDLLLGLSHKHPAFDELRLQVAEDAGNAPNGLLPNLLLVREGAIELL